MRTIYTWVFFAFFVGFTVTAFAHPRFPHAGLVMPNIPPSGTGSFFDWSSPIWVASKQSNQLIDLNHANIDTLRTLKGIGLRRAQAIIKYREAHGGFKQIDELAKIKCIGSKLAKKLKRKITLGHV